MRQLTLDTWFNPDNLNSLNCTTVHPRNLHTRVCNRTIKEIVFAVKIWKHLKRRHLTNKQIEEIMDPYFRGINTGVIWNYTQYVKLMLCTSDSVQWLTENTTMRIRRLKKYLKLNRMTENKNKLSQQRLRNFLIEQDLYEEVLEIQHEIDQQLID